MYLTLLFIPFISKNSPTLKDKKSPTPLSEKRPSGAGRKMSHEDQIFSFKDQNNTPPNPSVQRGRELRKAPTMPTNTHYKEDSLDKADNQERQRILYDLLKEGKLMESPILKGYLSESYNKSFKVSKA